MTLIKDGNVVENCWRTVDDNDEIYGVEAVIVSLNRWQNEKEALSVSNCSLGICLNSDQHPAVIASDVGHFYLIALEFSALADGRSFSYARFLRERYGFKGELRAVGEVTQDQLFFMGRCGFDSFELSEGTNVEKSIGALTSFSVAYQPAVDNLKPAYRLRHESWQLPFPG